MLNPALQVLLKDGTIVDNTYQLIAEDGIVPQGDVVVTTAQLDQLANILHYLVGLLDRVMAGDVFGIIKVLRTLAKQVHGFAALGYHRLAQVVVKVLFGIGVGCVEFSNTCVGHLSVPSVGFQSLIRQDRSVFIRL